MRVALIILMGFVVLQSCHESDQSTHQPERKIQVSTHSASFNQSVEAMLTAYNNLTEAFVNWDSASLPARALAFQRSLSGIPLREPGTGNGAEYVNEVSFLLSKVKDQNTPISSEKNISLTEKRRAFNALTTSLYNFLGFVKYDVKKLYLQECPMAFNDEEPGDWISDRDSIRNPYLGLHHPRYGKAMISCGNNKSVIDFTSKDK